MRLHDQTGWIEDDNIQGSTVAEIIKMLDLPSEHKWGLKVDGVVMTHGKLPSNADILEVISVDSEEDLQSTELSSNSGDKES